MSASSLIQENLARIQDQIGEIATKALRSPEEIRLIAVSKTHPVEQIMEVIKAGHYVFGENRVAEAVSKIDVLKETSSNTSGFSSEWHFIGHLQKNKVRFCPGNFQWIHSLDSLSLAKRLETRYRLTEPENEVNVLIQMNLSGESTKNGIRNYEEVLEIAEYLGGSEYLTLCGMMTMGKQGASERKNRDIFETLRLHCEDLRGKLKDPKIRDLSMGMSSDYPWAIAEGATMLRIGSAVFGERTPTN